jgi:hypothetical protein
MSDNDKKHPEHSADQAPEESPPKPAPNQPTSRPTPTFGVDVEGPPGGKMLYRLGDNPEKDEEQPTQSLFDKPVAPIEAQHPSAHEDVRAEPEDQQVPKIPSTPPAQHDAHPPSVPTAEERPAPLSNEEDPSQPLPQEEMDLVANLLAESGDEPIHSTDASGANAEPEEAPRDTAQPETSPQSPETQAHPSLAIADEEDAPTDLREAADAQASVDEEQPTSDTAPYDPVADVDVTTHFEDLVFAALKLVVPPNFYDRVQARYRSRRSLFVPHEIDYFPPELQDLAKLSCEIETLPGSKDRVKKILDGIAMATALTERPPAAMLIDIPALAPLAAAVDHDSEIAKSVVDVAHKPPKPPASQSTQHALASLELHEKSFDELKRLTTGQYATVKTEGQAPKDIPEAASATPSVTKSATTAADLVQEQEHSKRKMPPLALHTAPKAELVDSFAKTKEAEAPKGLALPELTTDHPAFAKKTQKDIGLPVFQGNLKLDIPVSKPPSAESAKAMAALRDGKPLPPPPPEVSPDAPTLAHQITPAIAALADKLPFHEPSPEEEARKRDLAAGNAQRGKSTMHLEREKHPAPKSEPTPPVLKVADSADDDGPLIPTQKRSWRRAIGGALSVAALVLLSFFVFFTGDDASQPPIASTKLLADLPAQPGAATPTTVADLTELLGVIGAIASPTPDVGLMGMSTPDPTSEPADPAGATSGPTSDPTAIAMVFPEEDRRTLDDIGPPSAEDELPKNGNYVDPPAPDLPLPANAAVGQTIKMEPSKKRAAYGVKRSKAIKSSPHKESLKATSPPTAENTATPTKPTVAKKVKPKVKKTAPAVALIPSGTPDPLIAATPNPDATNGQDPTATHTATPTTETPGNLANATTDTNTANPTDPTETTTLDPFEDLGGYDTGFVHTGIFPKYGKKMAHAGHSGCWPTASNGLY